MISKEEKEFDVVVVGGGPAGYIAAIRCRQKGLSVACIDAHGTWGGTCLHKGCIPSKSLLAMARHYHEAHERWSDWGIEIPGIQLNLQTTMQKKQRIIDDLSNGISFLFKKHDVNVITGRATFKDAHTLDVTSGDQTDVIHARHIIIATGSEAIVPSFFPQGDVRFMTSTEILALETIPPKLLIVGGGYIGLEMAFLWHHLGSQVSIIEKEDHILSGMDREMAGTLQDIMVKRGIHIHTGCQVTAWNTEDPENITATIQNGNTTDENQDKEYTHVLAALGRKPHTVSLGLNAINVAADDRGYIPTNTYRQVESHNHIYAIGDVVKGPMLAHRAYEDALMVASHIKGETVVPIEEHHIPSVIFTHPEAASVGYTEEDLKTKNIPYRVGRFAFSSNSRARAVDEREGWIKILAHQKTDEILGVHIIGAEASSLIGQGVMALEFGASSEDLARLCYPHPTFGEAFKEAALSVSNQALHS